MAVPKFKISKSKQRKRRTHDKLTAPHLILCENCGSKNPPHTICDNCGVYPGRGKKGKPRTVLVRDEG